MSIVHELCDLEKGSVTGGDVVGWTGLADVTAETAQPTNPLTTRDSSSGTIGPSAGGTSDTRDKSWPGSMGEHKCRATGGVEFGVHSFPGGLLKLTRW